MYKINSCMSTCYLPLLKSVSKIHVHYIMNVEGSEGVERSVVGIFDDFHRFISSNRIRVWIKQIEPFSVFNLIIF